MFFLVLLDSLGFRPRPFHDRYYHTNFDTPDKTSPAEMEERRSGRYRLALRVGPIRRRSTWRAVASAGEARLAKEQTDGATLPSAALVIPAWRNGMLKPVQRDRAVVGHLRSGRLSSRTVRFPAALRYPSSLPLRRAW